ncbi:MAG TPA: TIGR00730 family Rossman fold protein [Polyangiales bacterium]|nr:TIGR00730 family Rossman fold protein [Polyangiales bacterium]
MRVCVFCGSSAGKSPAYRNAAVALGELLAREKIGLVYGGATVGLMGVVADTVKKNGGNVIGVIPESLVAREIAHRGLSELRVVQSMHERKATMAELSDAFVAMPGGIGTLEELFEIWTWSVLGLHQKPCALFDVEGFYTQLTSFLDFTVEQGFLKPVHRALLRMESDPVRLLAALREPLPEGAATGKWIGPGQT